MGPFQVEALEEINRGRPPAFVIVSRKELEKTVMGLERWDTLLRQKVRQLAERGNLAVDQ
jgi:hypothetical protein